MFIIRFYVLKRAFQLNISLYFSLNAIRQRDNYSIDSRISWVGSSVKSLRKTVLAWVRHVFKSVSQISLSPTTEKCAEIKQNPHSRFRFFWFCYPQSNAVSRHYTENDRIINWPFYCLIIESVPILELKFVCKSSTGLLSGAVCIKGQYFNGFVTCPRLMGFPWTPRGDNILMDVWSKQTPFFICKHFSCGVAKLPCK